MGGNQFAGARLAGPVGEEDPGERVRLVRQLVLNARDEPAVAALDRLSGLIARLPTPVINRFMLTVGRSNDVQASNVPGVNHPLYLAGAEVLRTYPFGPLPGCASMITLLSYNGTCGVGINVDLAAVTDPALLAECLREGFDEVLALGCS
jgi:hypothetical protein